MAKPSLGFGFESHMLHLNSPINAIIPYQIVCVGHSTSHSRELSNGVDYVLMTNNKNEVVYVVKSVMRHDKEINDNESLYGVYVVGRETEGEIEISYHDYYSLERLIFQMGHSPEFLNCTTIKFRVAAVPHLIPFSPISDENREDYQRFFSN